MVRALQPLALAERSCQHRFHLQGGFQSAGRSWKGLVPAILGLHSWSAWRPGLLHRLMGPRPSIQSPRPARPADWGIVFRGGWASPGKTTTGGPHWGSFGPACLPRHLISLRWPQVCCLTGPVLLSPLALILMQFKQWDEILILRAPSFSCPTPYPGLEPGCL